MSPKPRLTMPKRDKRERLCRSVAAQKDLGTEKHFTP